MIDTAALKRLDPRPFLEANYGLAFRGSMALCPFHPDKGPSFSVYENGEGWAWKCHSPSCGAGGDVIAFVMRFEAVDFKAAAAKFAEWAGARGDTARPAPAEKATAPAPRPAAAPRKAPPGTFVEAYIYLDYWGNEAYQIHRFKDPKTFRPDRKVRAEDRVLYRLPEVTAAEQVWVVEGEKDVEAARRIGLVATTWPFGVNGWLQQYSAAFYDKDVLISLDRGYRAEEEKAARDIIKFARSVRIVELPGLTEKDQDITDWIEMHDAQDPGDLKAELERIAAETPLCGAEPDEFPGPEPDPEPKAKDPEPSPAPAPAAAEKAAANPDAPRFIIKKASEISTRPVEWIWPGVIPIGMTTLIEGDPDAGKTFILADLVARITRGLGFPLYNDQGPAKRRPGNVVYITSEGVPDQILVPRLTVAGADLDRVTIIEGVYDKHGSFEILDINEHLPALAQQLEEDPDFTVLVVDPLASHLSARIDMNSSAAMRNAMDGVSRFAERMKGAPIIALHLNKDDRKSPMHRAAGSGQIMAAVKSCWAAYQKPADEDKNRRYFGPVKSTCAPARRSFSFKIQNAPMTFSTGQAGEIGRVAWNLDLEDVDMKAALSPGFLAPVNKTNKAIAFLRTALADGQRRYVDDLEKEAADLEISIWNLKDAKAKERIEHARDGYQGRTLWFYPTREEKPQ